MVVGNGMIANRFISYKADSKKIIFASGVSNSTNSDQKKFLREFELLEQTLKNNPDKTHVYFSTCSIEDHDLSASPYVLHKIAIEDFIKKNAHNYHIFRVSNIAGISNNPYTILNYFIFNILQNHPFVIWKNACRNIIGIDDMFDIVNFILNENVLLNMTVNIANEANYSIPFIVKTIEKHFDRKGIYTEVNKGDNYDIDISLIKPIINNLNIQFSDDYLASLLKKYYRSK
jgi:hypothetical protein